MIGLYRLVIWFNKMKVNLDNLELGPHQDEEEEEDQGGVQEERQAKQPFVKRRLETIIEIDEDSG